MSRLSGICIVFAGLLAATPAFAEPTTSRNDTLANPEVADFVVPLTAGNVAAACFRDNDIAFPSTVDEIQLLVSSGDSVVERSLDIIVYGRETLLSEPSVTLRRVTRTLQVDPSTLLAIDLRDEAIVVSGLFCVGVISTGTDPIVLATDGDTITDTGVNWLLQDSSGDWIDPIETDIVGNLVLRAITNPSGTQPDADAGSDDAGGDAGDAGTTDTTGPTIGRAALLSITPTRGVLTEETFLELVGTGFSDEFTYRIGPEPLDDVVVLGPSLVTATLQPGSLDPGTYDVLISDSGQVIAQLPQGFQVVAEAGDEPPTITGVVPGLLPIGISSNIIVTGTGFQTGASVSIAGRPVAASTVRDDRTIEALISPNHTDVAGIYDVIVTNPDGLTATLTSAFIFSERDEGDEGGCAVHPTGTTSPTGTGLLLAAVGLMVARVRRARGR
jgi:hypothetical protein